QCEIRDAEVVQKAKEGKLSGWSFGFIPLKQDWEDGEIRHRDLRELELKEVSILDDTKIPAYDGTSIETRSEDLIEVRAFEDDIEVVHNETPEKEEKPFDNSEWEKRYMAIRAGL
ncbi:MAG TPA: HK97 family phage prohead protease, partial [Methanocorpusculum sp.]|nr:HK97 family phage prohead protease [Methanocorpusculum sp.]